MPVITIEFDGDKVSDEDANQLSAASQKIVSEVTKIEDVSVYGNSARIRIRIAPIEIFVRVSTHKIPTVNGMLADMKTRFAAWKKEVQFKHPINLTLIPMSWKFEIGI